MLRVTLDSVQEFRATTMNGGAETGRGSGADAALVTRSGTNELHGSLYEYHRNTASTNLSLTSSANWGALTSPLGLPRQMQFALRYQFWQGTFQTERC